MNSENNIKKMITKHITNTDMNYYKLVNKNNIQKKYKKNKKKV